jgi:hypothetical protein
MGDVFGPAIAVASLAAIAGTLVSGWRPAGDPTRRALVLIAISVVPAMLVGGILSEIDERLLEIGLLGYALAWAYAGVKLLARWSSPGP